MQKLWEIIQNSLKYQPKNLSLTRTVNEYKVHKVATETLT